MKQEVAAQQGASDQVGALSRPDAASVFPPETEIKSFDALSHLDQFEAEFPEQMKLFRLVGIHPVDHVAPVNPYTQKASDESYSNIGEHCIAVAYCARKIASLLQAGGVLSAEEVRGITERALVHDLNKPFEIMRREAKKAQLLDEVYSVSAYEELKPLLTKAGISEEVSEYLVQAGSETGHNSLRAFIVAGPNGIEGLVSGMLAEKIVHLSDDMTFTSRPADGHHPVSVFLTCRDRMLESRSAEIYPSLCTRGLGVDSVGSIVPILDLNEVKDGHSVLGTYAELQPLVANLIAREVQLFLDPENRELPENFVRRMVNSTGNDQ